MLRLPAGVMAVLLGSALCVVPWQVPIDRAVQAADSGAADVLSTQRIQPVLQKHCFDCHAGKSAKGGLRLDTLTPDFRTPETAAVWKNIAERVTAGTMPPAARPQPAAKDAQMLADWIEGELASADAARHKTEGRALLRRLNRVEYQNTLRDLLLVRVDVKDMLPEDESVDGFDNVGAVLTLSPVLMERYLEAADAALNAAIVRGPKPATTKARLSLKNERAMGQRFGRNALEKPDAVVLLDSTAAELSQFRASHPGRYRFRISAYAYQNRDRPLLLSVHAEGRSARGERPRLLGYFAVPADKPAVVEITADLGAREALQLVAVELGRVTIKDPAGYAGPGLAVEWIDVEGPLLDEWPPASHRQLLGKADPKTIKLADAEQALRTFIPRAFRRPVAERQLEPYLTLLRSRVNRGDSCEAALRVAVKAVLCGPNFLFLQERPGPLADFALAARLSYFLWSSMPDEELLDLAAKKTLHTPAVLRQQVERLLKDARAAALAENFVGQWLELRQIDASAPDPGLYPEYDELLRYSMPRETELFFEEILKNDRSLLDFVAADFSILNERLARHYGIAGVEGPEFRKVQLPPGSHRGGLLTQAALLKVTANGTVTSPVLRGVWVLKNILGQPVPPPPPNVPAIEPDIRGAVTIRAQLAKHRQVEACASCHQKIDPVGFALENFDAIGGWRETYRTLGPGRKLDLKVNGRPVQYGPGPRVEAGDTLPGGKQFKDIDEFKRIVLDDPDRIARCIAEKLVVYSTGTSIRSGDRDALTNLVKRVRARNYGLRSLIHEVIQSELFLSK